MSGAGGLAVHGGEQNEVPCGFRFLHDSVIVSRCDLILDADFTRETWKGQGQSGGERQHGYSSFSFASSHGVPRWSLQCRYFRICSASTRFSPGLGIGTLYFASSSLAVASLFCIFSVSSSQLVSQASACRRVAPSKSGPILSPPPTEWQMLRLLWKVALPAVAPASIAAVRCVVSGDGVAFRGTVPPVDVLITPTAPSAALAK